MNLTAADRQPSRERTIELGDRVEAAAGEHMVTDDVDLSFHPTLPGRPVGGQHIDAEAVMLSERGRLRMQRHRHTWRDMTPDHSLGAVVDDRAGHTAEVGEPPPVTIPEGGQIHAG